MEALLRWNSPELGLVSPGQFIPALEETRLIIDVGHWILQTVCGKIRQWQEKGYNVVPVAVNFSSVQFRQRDLAEMLHAAVKDSGLDPRLLTVEITESTSMEDIAYTKEVIAAIKKLGATVSIDDFGTGFSSLSYLKQLSADNLKIDRSFIKDIADNPDDASIVTTVIAMARNLNMKAIAEGVETEEQWKILRLLRCDMVQGFYFSRPVPTEEIEKLLARQSGK
jgi:EAL domain-containing protein (putative c-di-GMP-specific phosphodiesterase class I)